jgi:hypothetical protein
VLALGSSFTTGSEVNDDETWRAHLQQLTGWNVKNAGQGEYQAEQIALLAEQLMPIINAYDLIPSTIIGTDHASYARPKQHFTIENGELDVQGPPASHSELREHDHFEVKVPRPSKARWLGSQIVLGYNEPGGPNLSPDKQAS